MVLTTSSVWAIQMQRILKRYHVWVHCTSQLSSVISSAKSQEREQAYDIILELVKYSVATIEERFSNPYACWQHLSNLHQSKSRLRRLMLLHKLVCSRKEENFSMEQHLKAYETILVFNCLASLMKEN
uniref:Uncharacterized protein n=1 Tax=Physcomitrium patens TaxID=3218 RepID=A0A7I3ZAP2_PHYPA